jgi:hypothetical protein
MNYFLAQDVSEGMHTKNTSLRESELDYLNLLCSLDRKYRISLSVLVCMLSLLSGCAVPAAEKARSEILCDAGIAKIRRAAW